MGKNRPANDTNRRADSLIVVSPKNDDRHATNTVETTTAVPIVSPGLRRKHSSCYAPLIQQQPRRQPNQQQKQPQTYHITANTLLSNRILLRTNSINSTDFTIATTDVVDVAKKKKLEQ